MAVDWSEDLAVLPSDTLLEVASVAIALLGTRLTDPEAVHDFEALASTAPSRDWSGLDGSAGPGARDQGDAPGQAGERLETDRFGPPQSQDPDHDEQRIDGHEVDGSAGWSLPRAQRGVEDVARTLAAVQTALAGHVSRVLDDSGLRLRLLGIPTGKCPFRNASDWLVRHLRISRSEARRRLNRAAVLQAPPPEPSGHQPGPPLPVLSEAFHEGAVDISSLDLVATVLEDARRNAVLAGTKAQLLDELLSDGEEVLTRQARELDPDTLRKTCARWAQRAEHAVNPDGTEPREAQVSARQGLAYRGLRRGLHLWHLEADDLQHEVLSTIAGAATNPRSSSSAVEGLQPGGPGTPPATDPPRPTTDEPVPAGSSEGGHSPIPVDIAELGNNPGGGHAAGDGDIWLGPVTAMADPRTRHQRQLDGLIAALTGALALVDGNGLPASGGVRPQVLVTIDHETLLDRLSAPAGGEAEPGAGPPTPRPARTAFTSEAAFTGRVSPVGIRTLACDADIMPVVLGGQGQVLDIGRSQRLFPARLRKAITARDGGCAAPACTMPAPWCEVHHIQYWEHGGPTSVDNGVLLCSHHHHTVHGGSWDITVEDGVPWFIPAAHLDPSRVRRRNRHWKP